MSKRGAQTEFPKRIQDYTLVSLIGKGASSEVFRASREKRSFAIKLMRPPRGSDPNNLIASLRYEFWVLKDLKHPNIVHVHDFGCLEDGRIFLVEELIEGVSLRKFCAGRPFKSCEPALIGALVGLCELERWNIIHGDIKPGNILVATGEGGPTTKILDFGMARLEKRLVKRPGKRGPDEGPQSPELYGGTPSTMSPEIILHRPIDSRSDLYSLGVSLYAALAGQNPFVRGETGETLNAHLNVIPESLGLLRKDVPPHWVDLIHKMMNKNPADRPVSATQALRQIQERRFVLTPSRFIGREHQLKQISLLEKALKTGQKVALVPEGEHGVGVSRFLREIFYRLVGKSPELRDRIALVERQPLPKKQVLLIDRLAPPKGYRIVKVTLDSLTREEVEEWLEAALNLRPIPSSFFERVMGMTAGHPQSVWQLLKRLEGHEVLADAAGRVTATTLELIDWNRVVPAGTEGGELKRDFEWLAHHTKQRLLDRNVPETDPVWSYLESAVAATGKKAQKLLFEARLLSLKGEALIDLGKFERAREVLVAALEIFKHDEGSKFNEFTTRNFLAYILLRQGKVTEAVGEYERVLSEANESLSTEEASQMTNLELGFAYLQAKDYKKAVSRLNEELSLYGRGGVQRRLAQRRITTLYNLAEAHLHLKNYKEAQKFYRKANDKAREICDMALILRALNGLGNLFQTQDLKEKAIKTYGDALEVALALKDHSAAAAIVQNRGALRARCNSYPDAVQDLEDSLKYIEKVPARYAFEKTIICRSYVELGEIYAAQSKFSQAKDFLDRAWHLAETDEEIKGFRFWVLLARCRSWLSLQNEKLFKEDLSRLNYYADDEEKEREVAELEGRLHTFKADRTELSPSFGLEDELQAILRINRDLVGEMSLKELLGRILDHAIDLTGAELGVILLADKRGNISPALSTNKELDDDLSEISSSVAKMVLSTGNMVNTSDALEDKNFNQYESVISLNLRSILGVPISFKGKVLGILYLSHRYQRGIFDQKKVRITQAFADQVGLALKNHELLEFHRRSQEKLEVELDQTRKDLTRVETQLQNIPDYLVQKLSSHSIITRSPVMIDLVGQIERVAETNLPIILHGESGTGKEILARFAHQSSPRKKGPFVAINCGALPATLVESELFGYVKGAFTGADRDRVGLMEAATGGTIFLDEIIDLPTEIQVKFLRVLQEGEVTRVGETKARSIDIRVVVASQRRLSECVADGSFREDLYYRLMGFEADLPPLRERPDDVPILAEYFLKQYLTENNKKDPRQLTRGFVDLLTRHSWPGNIRELKSTVNVAASLSSGKKLGIEALPTYLKDRFQPAPAVSPLASAAESISEKTLSKEVPLKSPPECNWYRPGRTWREIELLIYASALEQLDYSTERVAVSLGVGVATVYKWLRENRLKESREEWRSKIQPYKEGNRLEVIKRKVFDLVAGRHPGHPYRAARELDVAPVTFYRWYNKGVKY